ncbi:MAG: hypothetical protein HWE20_03970 [Gammaproteobacteria bacterium]|nr:hypothetical protein [Gammaproteobacteria bacterium]
MRSMIGRQTLSAVAAITLAAMLYSEPAHAEFPPVDDDYLHTSIIEQLALEDGQTYEILAVDESVEPLIVKLLIDSKTVVILEIDRED